MIAYLHVLAWPFAVIVAASSLRRGLEAAGKRCGKKGGCDDCD